MQPLDNHFYSSKHGQTANTNRAKIACKNGPKYEIMKQLTAADPKQIKVLQQSWRGAQNMIFYSLWKTSKTSTGMDKLLCKKWAKWWPKKQVVVAGLKHKGALQQCWRGAKNKSFYSWWPGPKQYANMSKMLCKNEAQKRDITWSVWKMPQTLKCPQWNMNNGPK